MRHILIAGCTAAALFVSHAGFAQPNFFVEYDCEFRFETERGDLFCEAEGTAGVAIPTAAATIDVDCEGKNRDFSLADGNAELSILEGNLIIRGEEGDDEAELKIKNFLQSDMEGKFAAVLEINEHESEEGFCRVRPIQS